MLEYKHHEIEKVETINEFSSQGKTFTPFF